MAAQPEMGQGAKHNELNEGRPPDPQPTLELIEPAFGFVLFVADPDADVVDRLAAQLADRMVTVIHSADGADALLRIGSLSPDAVLVAAALPVVDGPTIVETLRRQGSSLPIVLGVGPDDGQATVRALGAGASACISRPYGAYEVTQLLSLAHTGDDRSIVCGPIILNPASFEVRLHDVPIYLPLREFKLLHLLMSRAERLVTRDEITARLWGGDPQRSNTITVHVRRLRERLGDDPHHPKVIQTVRGLGYRFIPPA